MSSHDLIAQYNLEEPHEKNTSHSPSTLSGIKEKRRFRDKSITTRQQYVAIDITNFLKELLLPPRLLLYEFLACKINLS
jgi:hypothetical protein